MLPDAALRRRFVARAADHFGAISRGEQPPKLDDFMAEVSAESIAALVGGQVPAPWEDARTLGKAPMKPGDLIVAIPEARTLLQAHGGGKRSAPLVEAVATAFMLNPQSEWTVPLLTSRIAPQPGFAMSKGGMASTITTLAKLGFIHKVRRGVFKYGAGGGAQ
jgi:hypothetical protein